MWGTRKWAFHEKAGDDQGRKPDEILLQTLSNLKCDGYVEEEKEDLGDFTFSVSLKGARNYELSPDGERGGEVVATSSENEEPFLLSDWKAKRIRKGPNDLIEKKD